MVLPLHVCRGERRALGEGAGGDAAQESPSYSNDPIYNKNCPEKKIFFFHFSTHTHTDLADILVHLILSEWALVFVVAEQPEARGAVKVVIGDVEVIGTSSEDSNLILRSSGRLH